MGYQAEYMGSLGLPATAMAVRSAFALLCFALLCGLAASSGFQSETETELTKNEGEAAGTEVLVEEALESRVARGSKNGKKNKKTEACKKNPKSERCKKQKARKNKPNQKNKQQKKKRNRQLQRKKSQKAGKGKGEGKGKGNGKNDRKRKAKKNKKTNPPKKLARKA